MSALSAIARYNYVELGNALPTPLNVTEERHEFRLTTAIETFQALRPGDAYEGRLAVRIVLCGAHAVESLRKATRYSDDFSKETRYRAQAASFMREERSAKRMLMQEQKVRLATEAVATNGSAQPMAAASPPPSAVIPAAPAPLATAAPLSPAQTAQPAAAARPVPPAAAALAPAVPPSPGTAASAPPATVRAAPPQPAQLEAVACPVPSVVVPLAPPAAQSAPRPVQAASAPPPSQAAIEKAETFAADNLEVAVRIRKDRGVTPLCRAQFREASLPTDTAVIDALVRGTSPLLNLLNDFGDEELDAAD